MTVCGVTVGVRWHCVGCRWRCDDRVGYGGGGAKTVLRARRWTRGVTAVLRATVEVRGAHITCVGKARTIRSASSARHKTVYIRKGKP